LTCLTTLDDVPSKLVLLLTTSAYLNKTFLRTFPDLTYDIVMQMIDMADLADCDEESALKVEKNVCLLIDIVYQDVIGLK
jgi:hypothetical protein